MSNRQEGMCETCEILEIVNNLTTYEKVDLLNYLVCSDQVEVVLNDDHAGIMYDEKEKPFLPPAIVRLNGQTIQLEIEIGMFEASAWESTEVRKYFGNATLESVPGEEASA